MSAISNFINTIRNAVYGEQVRGAIVDAITQCYDDVNSPSLNTTAFATVVAEAYENGFLDIQEKSTIAGMTNEKIIYRYTGNEAGYVHNALYYHDGTAWKPIGSGVQIASTAAGMTDTSAIYKYTGSEAGYFTNTLYYYNGTAWSPINDPSTQSEIEGIKSGYLKVGASVLTDGQKAQTRGSIGAAQADDAFPSLAKGKLVALLEKVAFVDPTGATYLNDLKNALGIGEDSDPTSDGDLGWLTLTNVQSNKYIGSDGSIENSSYETTKYCEDYFPVNPTADTVISITGDSYAFGIAEYDATYTFIKNETFTNGPWNAKDYEFDSQTRYIRFWWSFRSGTTDGIPEIVVSAKGTPLQYSIGDIDSTTGADSTINYRIRTAGVQISNEKITVSGCPFAKTWNAWHTKAGYIMRCYQSPSTFLGSVTDASAGDASRPFFDADITDKLLLTGTDYVRFVMARDGSSNISSSVVTKANITINGVKYWLVLST